MKKNGQISSERVFEIKKPMLSLFLSTTVVGGVPQGEQPPARRAEEAARGPGLHQEEAGHCHSRERRQFPRR